MQNLDSSSAALDVPVFLVGAERSGSTLLRLMLDHHPDIIWQFEFEFVVDLVSDSGEWPDLDEYYEYLSMHRIFRSTGFAIDHVLDYPSLVRSFLAQRLAPAPTPLLGATCHHHFDRLLHLWPHARFIHLLRDGRDVSRSVVKKGWAGNVWTAATWWIEAEDTWERLKDRISASRWAEVRYEELAARPESVLHDLCQFLGVPYDPAMLTYPEHTTYGPPRTSSAGQWRRVLAPRQIRFIEAQVASLLAERSYPLSGLAPMAITPALRRWLCLHNWVARARFNIGRYGPWLIAQGFLARRLRLRAWERYVHLRKQEIETALLQ